MVDRRHPLPPPHRRAPVPRRQHDQALQAHPAGSPHLPRKVPGRRKGPLQHNARPRPGEARRPLLRPEAPVVPRRLHRRRQRRQRQEGLRRRQHRQAARGRQHHQRKTQHVRQRQVHHRGKLQLRETLAAVRPRRRKRFLHVHPTTLRHVHPLGGRGPGRQGHHRGVRGQGDARLCAGRRRRQDREEDQRHHREAQRHRHRLRRRLTSHRRRAGQPR
mmetsp:Transcript_12544/g.31694  ORF Transcript_12544/g.31694 Transcript_12544/m.31694 type:complete len:217 (+) Transcript_12544:632-1282(+)